MSRSVYDWKYDEYRGGYVNRHTGQVVPYELVRRAGIVSESLLKARTEGARAALLYTFDRINELAASLSAQESAEGVMPCPCCEGAGSFLHCLMFVQCSVCGGSGKLKREEEP